MQNYGAEIFPYRIFTDGNLIKHGIPIRHIFGGRDFGKLYRTVVNEQGEVDYFRSGILMI